MFTDMSPTNPFFDCLIMLDDKGMDDAGDMATACEYDVCILQDNADQVTEAACSALSNLNQVCEMYNKYPDWRETAGCRKYYFHPFVSMHVYFCTIILASFLLFPYINNIHRYAFLVLALHFATFKMIGLNGIVSPLFRSTKTIWNMLTLIQCWLNHLCIWWSVVFLNAYIVSPYFPDYSSWAVKCIYKVLKQKVL